MQQSEQSKNATEIKHLKTDWFTPLPCPTSPLHSVIGTSSLRRAAQLTRLYPQFTIENIRGNLNTRFQKLAEAHVYDAIILAVAGLERMRWDHCISQVSRVCVWVCVCVCENELLPLLHLMDVSSVCSVCA